MAINAIAYQQAPFREFFNERRRLGPWNDQPGITQRIDQVEYHDSSPSTNEVVPTSVVTRNDVKRPGFNVITTSLFYNDIREILEDQIEVYGGPIADLFSEVAAISIEFSAHLVITNTTNPNTPNAAFGTQDTYVEQEWLLDFGTCLTAVSVVNRQFRPSPKGCFFLATIHGLSKIIKNIDSTFFRFMFKVEVDGHGSDDYRTKPRDDLIYANVEFELKLGKIHEFILGSDLALLSSDNDDDTTHSDTDDEFEILELSHVVSTY